MDYPYSLLVKIKKPSRYLGKEPVFPYKDWNTVSLRLCFVYPDLYEIGRCHLGIVILTNILNNLPDVIADTAFGVMPDFERILKSKGYPLLSTNYRKPLSSFDAIGINYGYELLATGILQILDLAGLPFKAEERDERFPVVFGGGACCGNPEPVAPFYDFLMIGDSEENILDVVKLLKLYKEGEIKSKEELLKELVKIPGIYVPLFKNRVKRQIVMDLERYSFNFGVPVIELSHDRIPLEISRGCTRGCRFCQAGTYYRPVREKSIEWILNEMFHNFEKTGYRDASLMSLSAGDFTVLLPLVRILKKIFSGFSYREFNVSLPSLRVGSINEEILEFIGSGKKSGLTFAPEAGTERLRATINKDIVIERLFKDAELAFKLGWRRVKLYFMIGLPTEREEDLEGIYQIYRELKRRCPGMQVTVSTSTFVPKPHTPFQWERQISIEETREKIRYLKKTFGRHKKFYKYHNPFQSFLEGVISRGDRRLSELILKAYELGARLDGWQDFFSFDIWLEAQEKTGINLQDYLRERPLEEELPWDHIDLGISKQFLLKERKKAYEHKITRDCRFFNCYGCGICKKGLKNKLLSGDFAENYKSFEKFEETLQTLEEKYSTLFKGKKNLSKEKWVVFEYSRLGKGVFLSQIEITRFFILTLRRLGVVLSYTQGMSPHPKVITPQALPVGVFSRKEKIAFCLHAEKAELEKLRGFKVYSGIKILDFFVFEEKPSLFEERKVFKIIPLKEKFFKELKGKLKDFNSEKVKIRFYERFFILETWDSNFSLGKFFKNFLTIDNFFTAFIIIKEI